MEKMYVYSGNVREGTVGEPTPLIDMTGKELFVGDIVMVSTIDQFGVCDNTGLTAVVSDRWTSYSDGTHVEKKEGVEYFVMGIKSVDFMGKDSERWIVKRMKSHIDVVPGEHWRDYGFSYKSE